MAEKANAGKREISRFRILLTPLRDAIMPKYLGEKLHGFFFEILNESGFGGVVSNIHAQGLRPYSISQLKGRFLQESEGILLQRGREYSFHISSISEELSTILSDVFTKLSGSRKTLGRIGFEIFDIQEEKGSPTSYEEILRRVESWKNKIPKRVNFEFLSPTAFTIGQRAFGGGGNIPLPMPRLVFGSLSRVWNAFSSVEVDYTTGQKAEGLIVIARHKVETCEPVVLRDSLQIGFIGSCTFEFTKKATDEFRRTISALSILARYSGVGKKTTMGMGEVSTDIHF